MDYGRQTVDSWTRTTEKTAFKIESGGNQTSSNNLECRTVSGYRTVDIEQWDIRHMEVDIKTYNSLWKMDSR